MKKLTLCNLFLFLLSPLFSQVGVGTITPDASAVIDLSSTTKGMLMPRMSTAQRNAIASPASGLIILNLDDKCIDIYDGADWIKNCGYRVTGTDTAASSVIPIANFGGTARRYAVGFSIGTKGYLGTGNDGMQKKDFWEYDPANNIWTQKADFGGSPREKAVGFAAQGKGYIGTGFDGNYKSDFWEYNPVTNTWVQKANLPALGRSEAVGFELGGYGLVGLGRNPAFDDIYNDMFMYYPQTNLWEQKSACPFRGYSLVGFGLGNTGYVGIGIVEEFFFGEVMSNIFYEINPAGSGTWTPLQSFPGAERTEATGLRIGTKGYVGMGRTLSSAYYSDVWEYTVLTNTWEEMPDIGSTGRSAAVGFEVNGVGYIGTGYDGTYKSDFYALEPYPIGPVYENTLDVEASGGIEDGIWIKDVDQISTAHRVDIAADERSLTHPTGLPFYVSGVNQSSNGAEFRRNDGKQGIGIGYGWIYATGSDPSHDIGITAKGVSGDLLFNTNGAERMRITPAGNIGIGVYPNAPLQLSNALANRKMVLFETANNDHQFLGFGVNSGSLRYQVAATSGDHIFYAGTSTTTSNELIRIKGNGNVGIGTTTPVYKLDVKTGINQHGISHTDGGVTIATYVGNAGEIGTISNHSFRLFANNGVNQFQILPNGNISIGLITPENKLDISNGAARTGTHATGRPLYITGTLSDASNGVEIRHADATQGIGFGKNTIYAAGTNTDQNLGLSAKGSAGHLVFSTNNIERARITGGGNLGIGTTTPNAPLQFATSVALRKIVLYEVGNNDHQFHGFGINGNGSLVYQTGATANDHVFSTGVSAAASNELMRISGLGKIGIGIISPQNKLDINSGATRTGTHPTNLPLYVTGIASPASGGAEFRHDNGTQGVGIGYNTIYAAGSDANHNLGLTAKGASGHLLFSANGGEKMRITSAGLVGIGTTTPHAQLQLATSVANRKLILYEVGDNDHQFHGFGINGDGALRYQTATTANDHVFFAATSATTSNELVRIKGTGNLAIAGVVEVESFIAPTFINGFTNYGAGHAEAAYYKDKMGRVYLRGLVNNVNNPTGLVVFNLPAGYRPTTSGQLVFSTIANNALGRIDILANGDVVVNLGAAGWINLDGISFRAD